jgi:transketolase
MRRALVQGGNGPVLVILNTIKGRGLPDVAGRMESHYLPLSAQQYADAMANFATTP